MARNPAALPPSVGAAAFSVRQGADAGVSRQRMRHASLLSPAHGLRTSQPAESLRDHARALAVVLPQPWAYSHETAAELLGLPIPRNWQPGVLLDVVRPTASARVRRPGMRGRRGLESRAVLHLDGIPVTEPVDTWCDLAMCVGLTDLVVAGDAVLNRIGGATAVLADAVTERRGHRGARALTQALPMLRVGSGSPMESRARLAFRGGGLPEPELNADILDEHGNWVARADFVWRSARVIVEYEGDEHRTDRRRWQTDIARLRQLEDLGWRVIRITARDLRTPHSVEAMVERIRRAIIARMQ